MNNEPDQSRKQSNLSNVITLLWAPIAGFAGAITLVVQVIQLWRGDQATVTYVATSLGALLLLMGLFWVVFSRKSNNVPDFIKPGQTKKKSGWRYKSIFRWLAFVGLFICLLLGAGGGYVLYLHRQELAQKTVILVANFDGPEDTFGVTNKLLEQLNEAVKDYSDIVVTPLGQPITVEQGSQYARKIGNQYFAEIVIWGWYRQTENPDVTIHIENLSSQSQTLLQTSADVLQPRATISDLESFTLQQKVGEEMSSVVFWIDGYAHYDAGDYQGALDRFQRALTYPWPENAINQSIAHLLVGITEYRIGMSVQAISEFLQSLQYDPKNFTAYDNLGLAYTKIGMFDQALENYKLSLQIEPLDATSYLGQGDLDALQGEYKKAISDFTMAIQLDPKNSTGFANRSFAYSSLHQDNLALTDATKAIQLDPKFFGNYMNRGLIYLGMNQFDRAINDFSRAVRISPQSAIAYSMRGNGYYRLKQYDNALADYAKAIVLDPTFVLTYTNRGYLYFIIGKNQSAINDYDEALTFDPSDAMAYFDLGLAYAKLGQKNQATTDFQKCINLSSDASLKLSAQEQLQKLAKP